MEDYGSWQLSGMGRISTLLTDGQAFTLSGRALERVGKGARRASGKAEFPRQERTESEAEEDLLNGVVAIGKSPLMVPLAGVEALVDVSDFVQKDLADKGRPANTHIRWRPKTAWFFRVTAEGEDANLQRGNKAVRNEAGGRDAFAQREADRNAG